MFECFELTPSGLKALRSRFAKNEGTRARINGLISALESAPDGVREVCIPFPGFYESIISKEAGTNWSDWTGEGYETPELVKAMALGFDRDEIIDEAWRFANERKAWPEIATAYTALYEQGLSSQILAWAFEDNAPFGVSLDVALGFIRVESPREYNFTTDACVCKIPAASLAVIFHIAEKCGFWDFWRKRMAPRDGFIPFSDISLLGDSVPFTMTPAAAELLFEFFLSGDYFTTYTSFDGVDPDEQGYMAHDRVYGPQIAEAAYDAYGAVVWQAVDDCAAAMIEQGIKEGE